ncbi:hypothetical protein [Pedobacter sp. UBA4863]|uniref:hypothetical protein n=1 Tax=Pedobacter sp. UBA4863 TaxID=1947060 RepID=UPI0025F16B8D|nr:hypothetical protein [Pedobacter sp. UBA4863]
MKKIYLSLLSLMLGSPALMAQIYVTEAGAGLKNGTSWANAYDNTQLQQAINEAESATTKQVWVAKGIYKPTERLSEEIYAARTDDGTIAPTAANDSDKSFILKTGVAIYGGFAGTEATIAERTSITTLNETILSGDLNNSNTANTDDAYHVVAARDDADGSVLDGFTIQHGYGNDGNYAQITGDRIRRSIGAAIAVFTAKTVTFNNLVT